MAGVKGRSGGARPNSGPKPRPPDLVITDDPQAFLLNVMQGLLVPSAAQLSAAKSLMAAQTRGKKEAAADKARQAAGGRFKPRGGPLKLVSSG
jgi:phage terminase small subunit